MAYNQNALRTKLSLNEYHCWIWYTNDDTDVDSVESKERGVETMEEEDGDTDDEAVVVSTKPPALRTNLQRWYVDWRNLFSISVISRDDAAVTIEFVKELINGEVS